MDQLKKREFNISNIVKPLIAVAFSNHYEMAFKATDSEALGLGFMSDEQRFKIISQRIRGEDYEAVFEREFCIS